MEVSTGCACLLALFFFLRRTVSVPSICVSGRRLVYYSRMYPRHSRSIRPLTFCTDFAKVQRARRAREHFLGSKYLTRIPAVRWKQKKKIIYFDESNWLMKGGYYLWRAFIGTLWKNRFLIRFELSCVLLSIPTCSCTKASSWRFSLRECILTTSPDRI